VAHEFSVVFPQGAGSRLIAGVADVRAGRPLPDVAVELEERTAVIAGDGTGRMIALGLQKMTGQRSSGGSGFPFLFRGEAAAAPVRKGVCLIVAHMTDRLVRVQGTPAAERCDSPGAALPVPVERRRPGALLPHRPAVGKPERGPVITTVLDECQKF